MTRAIVLVNVGTPDKPGIPEVRKYLHEFLNDPMVIDLPWIVRKILVNGIIIPFRVRKSTALYKRLWTPQGSPLKFYLEGLTKQLQQMMTANCTVYSAMRYGNPSLRYVLNRVYATGAKEIIVIPLFPQYADSTTGTVIKEVEDTVKDLDEKPLLHFMKQFYNHPAFIRAFASKIREQNPAAFDHILFSYHGLPVSHVQKIHPGQSVTSCHCESSMPSHGKQCYKATCYETSRILANSIGLSHDKWSVGFQSRLTKNWLSPFTDELLVHYASRGVKRILVVAPSFVADCLETVVEIGEDYRQLFLRHGGDELVLAESLNASESWTKSLAEMISEIIH